MQKRADGHYLLRALFGNPDLELHNAQVQADWDAKSMQYAYNKWRREHNKVPVDFDRAQRIISGWTKHPPRRIPVDYNDPRSIIRGEYENKNYLRTVSQDAYNNEDFYKQIRLTPRDKATMGAPIEPKRPKSHNIPEPTQTKRAGQMITYKQAYMAKQAGLFGNTMVGRGITNLFGPHTFVSDALGASAMDMINHEAQQLYSQPAVYTPPAKPQPKPAPPVVETKKPTYTSTGKRQGYRTPDGQWHDIGTTTPTQAPARQPAPTTTNWKSVPKGHENQKQVAQNGQRRTVRRG